MEDVLDPQVIAGLPLHIVSVSFFICAKFESLLGSAVLQTSREGIPHRVVVHPGAKRGRGNSRDGGVD